MTTRQKKFAVYQAANCECARIILADVAKYGGEGALLVQFARRVLEKPATAAGGPMRRDEVYSSAADAGNTVELPRGRVPCERASTLSAMRRRHED
jgi:hypothetical protein